MKTLIMLAALATTPTTQARPKTFDELMAANRAALARGREDQRKLDAINAELLSEIDLLRRQISQIYGRSIK